MEEERRRGEEYKGETVAQLSELSDDKMRQNSASGFRKLKKSISEKSSKGYDDSVGLIVYFNVHEFYDEEDFVEGVKPILESLQYKFPTIDILEGNNLYRFTKDNCGNVTWNTI